MTWRIASGRREREGMDAGSGPRQRSWLDRGGRREGHCTSPKRSGSAHCWSSLPIRKRLSLAFSDGGFRNPLPEVHFCSTFTSMALIRVLTEPNLGFGVYGRYGFVGAGDVGI